MTSPLDPPPSAPKESEVRDTLGTLRQEIVRGLLYIHSRLDVNTDETLEARSLVVALVDMLVAKGLITTEEMENARQTEAARLATECGAKGFGVVLQTAVEDKYATDEEIVIDCAGRVAFCRAACCRLGFALSRQDVKEGVVRWDMEKPYLIARSADGSCAHLDRPSLGCSVWTHRPAPCRAFDCRRDRRIWLDFEKKIPNPDITRADWPRCVSLGGAEGTFDVEAMETLDVSTDA